MIRYKLLLTFLGLFSIGQLNAQITLKPVEEIYAPDSIVIQDYDVLERWQVKNGISREYDTAIGRAKMNEVKRMREIHFKEFHPDQSGIRDSIKLWIKREDLEPGEFGYMETISSRGKDGLPDTSSVYSRYYLIDDEDTLLSLVAVSPDWMMPPFPDVVCRHCFSYQSPTGVHSVVFGIDLSFRYSTSIAPTFVEGRPFYLFRQDDGWGWSFDGVDHTAVWDSVFYHYGDGGGWWLEDQPSWQSFNALRDGMWYLVRFERE